MGLAVFLRKPPFEPDTALGPSPNCPLTPPGSTLALSRISGAASSGRAMSSGSGSL